MDIRVTRRWRGLKSTLSNVVADDQAHHFFLEDRDRGLSQKMPLSEILEKKVKAATAIPEGRYQVIVTYSNRFKRLLPILLNVPGYEGIRIHPGNSHLNTEGCLLPGMSYLSEDGDYRVVSSVIAFDKIFAKINKAIAGGEKVWLTIESKY